MGRFRFRHRKHILSVMWKMGILETKMGLEGITVILVKSDKGVSSVSRVTERVGNGNR